MKKIKLLFALFILIILTGCGKDKEINLSENIQKIELTGNLVTYQAYYHNVLEYEKEPSSGIQHLFEKKRTLFAEYMGTIKYGINLSKVKIEVNGNNINVLFLKLRLLVNLMLIKMILNLKILLNLRMEFLIKIL